MQLIAGEMAPLFLVTTTIAMPPKLTVKQRSEPQPKASTLNINPGVDGVAAGDLVHIGVRRIIGLS